ncbi:helix-turn-helix transcriptional regulator [Pseudonocardia sp. KRD291]|uniref:ArsR/SmtB family transcription factor n=1 Tax=Pseudonocardia sp. KRD291 TaxID=2792007 RepID=UPI001C49E94A|nr:metalloregulator ArsR/SmtB family transcription factor [Pseudonocardia sp. KRD291]MBW0101502.1 helix-turn-helix transcriptional regulator [Pseudonocardia sp. KRD291]
MGTHQADDTASSRSSVPTDGPDPALAAVDAPDPAQDNTLQHDIADGLADIAADAVAGDAAALFKALADPRRLQLVALAQQAPQAEVCFCDLIDVFPLPQSSLSHHLRVLVDAGVFERERRGTWSWYRLRDEAVAQLTDALRLDGLLHQLLRREHADNPKLISATDAPASQCGAIPPAGD